MAPRPFFVGRLLRDAAIFAFLGRSASSLRSHEFGEELLHESSSTLAQTLWVEEHQSNSSRTLAGATVQTSAPPRGTRVIAEDLMTHDLLGVLETETDSTYWSAAAEGLALHMLRLRERIRSTDTADAETGTASFIEVSTNSLVSEDLDQEHELVRNAIRKALGSEVPRRFADEREELLTCANDMVGIKPEDGKTADSKAKELGDGMSLPTSGGKSLLQEVFDEIAVEVKKLRNDFREFANFFFAFLRWEIQLPMIGGGFLPQIGFKCQPLFECVRQVINLPKAFLKLIASLVRVIGKGLWALVKVLARRLGMRFGGKGASPKQQSDDEFGTDDINLKVELKGNKDGDVPDPDSVDKFVDAQNMQLFDDYTTVAGKCRLCQGRLKGVFGMDIFDMLKHRATAQIYSILGTFKMFITSVPKPLRDKGAQCMSCLKKFKEDVSQLFGKSSLQPTDKYFAKGQCNAHTVGLCMILEKTRSCKLTMTEKVGREIDQGSGDGHEKQKQFCKAFAGVTLRLTQPAQEGVRCPEQYRDELWEKRNERIKFNESQVSKLDFERGCQLVRKALRDYNMACERDVKEHGKGKKRVGVIRRLSRGLSGLVLKYEYKNVREIYSTDDIVQKCRTLYQCHDDQEQYDVKDTRVNWNELQRSIRDIVSKVDDFQGQPQSYQPEEATKAIMQLLEESSKTWSTFSDTVSRGLAETSKKGLSWGPRFKYLFSNHLWDDRCFTGLHHLVDDRISVPANYAVGVGPPAAGPKKRIQVGDKTSCRERLYSRIGAPGRSGEKPELQDLKFFGALSRVIGVDRWKAEERCELDWYGFRGTIPFPATARVAGPKMDLLVLFEAGQWSADWDKGQINLQALGISETSLLPIELVRMCGGCETCTCKNSQWYLKRCAGSRCAGARTGALLVNLTIQGDQTPTITSFLQNSMNFLKNLHETDKFLLRGGDGPSGGNDFFKQALKVAHRWEEDMLAKASYKMWAINDEVEVRNHHDESWRKAQIVSLDPLLVDYQQGGRWLCARFNQIRDLTAPFRVGQKVLARNNGAMRWKGATVASLSPLMVYVGNNTDAKEFDQVRHEQVHEVAKQRTLLNSGHIDFATVGLARLRPILQKSDELRDFFRIHGWTLQDKGTDERGQTEVEFRINDVPVSTMEALTDVVRLLSRPTLDAQRSVRSGVTDMGFALVSRRPERIIYENENPTGGVDSAASQVNPMKELYQGNAGFAAKGEGLARVRLEFMDWAEQNMHKEFDLGARRAEVLKQMTELFTGGSNTAAAVALRKMKPKGTSAAQGANTTTVEEERSLWSWLMSWF